MVRFTQPNNSGVDFMAIARGQQLARDLNHQDRARAMQELGWEEERYNWQNRMQEMQANRQAQAYVAPLITHLQTASQAGMSPTDYLISQREQILADPNFQQFAPEVQNRVLNTLGQSARAQIQDLQRLGYVDDLSRLSEAFGFTNAATPLMQASLQGSPESIIQAANQMYGSQLAIDENGMVNISGTLVPADMAAYQLASTMSGASTLPLASQQREANAAADFQRQQMDMLNQMYGGLTTGVPGQQPAIDPLAALSAYQVGTGQPGIPVETVQPSVINPAGVPSGQTMGAPAQQQTTSGNLLSLVNGWNPMTLYENHLLPAVQRQTNATIDRMNRDMNMLPSGTYAQDSPVEALRRSLGLQ